MLLSSGLIQGTALQGYDLRSDEATFYACSKREGKDRRNGLIISSGSTTGVKLIMLTSSIVKASNDEFDHTRSKRGEIN